MSRKAKIIWTLTEESDFYAAFVTSLQKRRLAFPVQSSDLKAIMESAREGVLVLKVERRREMSSVDSIRGDVAKRLIDNGIFPRNYLEALRRNAKVANDDDPQAKRIEELTAKVTQLEGQLQASEEEIGMLGDQLREAQNQPTPAQAIQRLVAETLAMALSLHDDSRKPEGVRVQREREEIPAFERERRKDPVAAASGGVNGARKPKFALVADFVGSDKAAIQSALGELADLRYLDAQAKLQGLKDFNANGGRIVMWTDFAPHDWERSLTAMGVSFNRFKGTLPALIEHVRVKARS